MPQLCGSACSQNLNLSLLSFFLFAPVFVARQQQQELHRLTVGTQSILAANVIFQNNHNFEKKCSVQCWQASRCYKMKTK